MNVEMTEITLEEQQQVVGGDWYDAVVGILEGLAFSIGIL